MKIKNLLLSITLLLAGFPALAQQYNLTAKLVDSASGEPVSFATASIFPKGSSKVYKYALSSDDGSLTMENVKAGTYTFKSELLGYKPFEKEITVKAAMDLGEIKMVVDKEVLDAASVSAVGNPIVIKKDTIEYNASSFKTTDNDVLEDLLKKLPGVEVSEDGSVTVNGQSIDKITIDGKTFFLDDPQLASKNIPAKIINKVKVIEKKSEQAEFTGIDDGEEEHVIDLNIKPGMMKGSFGNIMAGAGHDIPAVSSEYDDTRFQGAAFVGKFTDKTQLSLILNANNTNNRGFNDLSGSMMGNMRGGGGGMGGGRGGWGSGNGITTSYMGGVNGAWDLFDDKMELGANYLYNATKKDVKENSIKTTYLDDYDLVYNSGGYSLTNSYGNRMGLRLEHKFSENTSILFQPQLNFGSGNFTEFSDFDTKKVVDGVQSNTNDGWNSNLGFNKNWSTEGFFLLRQRLGIPGRTLTAHIRYSFSNNQLDGFNQSRTTSYYESEAPQDSIVNQRYNQLSKSSSISTRVTYTEPLGNHLYVEANYGFTWSKSNSVKDTYDSAVNDLFTEDDHEYRYDGEILNSIYSNEITNTNISHSIGGNVMYQNDKLRAQLGMSARPTKTTNETFRNGQWMTYDPGNVLNWSPQAMFFYDINEDSNIRFFYFGRTSQPATSKLMPVPDNTDPLDVSFGNPMLKPYFSHDMHGEFRINNKETFASMSLRADGGFVQNPIVNATWYGKNGAQYSMPFNGPTSANASIFMFANIPIAKSNFSIMDMTSLKGSRSTSYVGSNIDIDKYYDGGEMDYDKFLEDYKDIANSPDFISNTITTLNVSERLRLTYRNDNLELRASGRTRFSKSWYTIADKTSTTTWNNQLDFSVNWTCDPIGMTFKADYDYNWYNGYTTEQPDEHLINAEINKLLFKNKVTLALKCYDILGQSKNLDVSYDQNYYKETVNNTLGRYVILSLTYRFGTFDRDRMRGGNGPGGHGPGGPPPGGGPR